MPALIDDTHPDAFRRTYAEQVQREREVVVERPAVGERPRGVYQDTPAYYAPYRPHSVVNYEASSTLATIGGALIGAKVGDTVEVKAPKGSWKARVVDVRSP